MRFLAGFVLGMCVLLVMGAAVERYHVTLSGEFEKVGIYQPALSGVSAEGNCYLAVTNTETGKTQVFGITKETQKKLADKAFQIARGGGVIVELER